MKQLSASAVIGLTVLFCAAASAKDLYVDSVRGNDAVSYAANTQSTPWRTLGRATRGSTSPSSTNPSEAARAGDTVYVTGGPFVGTATEERYIPAFNPVNSGSAGSPIAFRAVGSVELRTEGGRGPVIGAYRSSYIHWYGFVIDERYAAVHPDTGPIVVWETTGVVVDGCEIRGITQTYGDNHNGVRFERAVNSAVRNCRISGIRGTNTSEHNSAGVMLYGSNGIVIENNEILNSGAAIFPKGADNYDITIRFNRLTGNSKGIRTSYSSPTMGANRIYQNIIENSSGTSGMGIQIAEYSYNWSVFNNTIVNVVDGILFRDSSSTGNLRWGNNLIYGGATAANAGEWQGALPGNGRNLYYLNQSWAHQGVLYRTLSTWFGAVPADSTSVSSDPRLIGLSSGDYRLAADSPGRGLGRDLLDLNRNGSTTDVIPVGAYISGAETIGRSSGTEEVVAPTPPSNVVVE